MTRALVALLLCVSCAPFPERAAVRPSGIVHAQQLQPGAPVPVELTGTLEALIIDDPAVRHWQAAMTFVDDSGTRYDLKGAHPAELEHGARVTVRGWAGAETPRPGSTGGLILWAESVRPTTGRLAPLQRRGVDRTLAIVATFEGASAAWPPDGARSLAEIEALVFGDAGLRGWLEAQSHGRYSITGDVTGVYTLPCSPQRCDHGQILTLAYAAAKARGFDPAAYTRHLVFFYPTAGNGWWGLGTIGGEAASWSLITHRYELQVVAHELGHNLGLFHSHSCKTGTGLPGQSACVHDEYGDTGDVMGGEYATSLHPFQLRRLGWLDADGVPSSVTTDTGRVALVAAHDTTLRSPRALFATGTTPWAVQFRRKLGWDAGTYLTNVDGALLRFAKDDVNFYLVDHSPATDMRDPVVLAGATFVDGSFRMAVAGVGETLTLDVGAGPTPPPATPTSTKTPTPSATRTPENAVAVTIVAAVRDGCCTLRVTVDVGRGVQPVDVPVVLTATSDARRIDGRALVTERRERTTGRDGRVTANLKLARTDPAGPYTLTACAGTRCAVPVRLVVP